MAETICSDPDSAREYLREHGYDGLYCPDAWCACLLDDLAPCGEEICGCRPGYKVPCDCDQECNFHVQAKKPAVAAGQEGR